MKFNVHAYDKQTKVVATIKANTADEAITIFQKEWDPQNRLIISKVTGPLGYHKVASY